MDKYALVANSHSSDTRSIELPIMIEPSRSHALAVGFFLQPMYFAPGSDGCNSVTLLYLRTKNRKSVGICEHGSVYDMTIGPGCRQRFPPFLGAGLIRTCRLQHGPVNSSSDRTGTHSLTHHHYYPKPN